MLIMNKFSNCSKVWKRKEIISTSESESDDSNIIFDNISQTGIYIYRLPFQFHDQPVDFGDTQCNGQFFFLIRRVQLDQICMKGFKL